MGHSPVHIEFTNNKLMNQANQEKEEEEDEEENGYKNHHVIFYFRQEKKNVYFAMKCKSCKVDGSPYKHGFLSVFICGYAILISF